MTSLQDASPNLGRLGRELRQVCAQATQPEEIAAALEATGLNDDLVREQYGLPDVFACAEALYSHLPYTAPAVRSVTVARPMWRLAPRGVLYALPGAALAVASPLLTGAPAAQEALMASVIFGWGWGQGLASIGYRRTGEPLRRFLWQATLLTLPVAAAVGAGTALLAHQPVLAAALVAGVAGTSFAGFASLLILGQLPLAAVAYLPSVAYLLLGQHDPVGGWVAALTAALLPLVALAGQPRPPAGLQLPDPAWHATLAHAISGWTCALFVTGVFSVALHRLGALAILPVIVSVGAMEVLSVQFYGQLRSLAARHGQMLSLAGHALRTLGVALAVYLGVLLALLGAFLLITRPEAWADPRATVTALLPLLVYGCALLLGTVVSNVGQPWLSGMAWLLGSGAALALLPLAPSWAPLLGALLVLICMSYGVVRALLVPTTYH
ncbi:hypothetical protein [Deinococcus sonorensis]|uniref:Integral membrane protein n=2 Tax=Deinococcus sonorensis TaxID=309891 RepID=A0AAU7U4Z8_9DEIO